MIFTKYGGRRFLMVIGCAAVSTVLVWFGKVSGAEFVTLISLTVGAYIAGNTYQKKAEAEHDSDRDSKKDNQA
jgi:hypothetical protein